MGQKVNPNGLRIGITRTWDSVWYSAGKAYTETLHQDLEIRKFLDNRLKGAGAAKVQIERTAKDVVIHIHTSRPGMVIGPQGSNIEKLRSELEKVAKVKLDINVIEVKKPQLSAKLVGEMVANQITKRMPYRRAVKSALEKTMDAGAKGIKIKVAGRLNGVEIARSEHFTKGKIPLHTLRADISYATTRSATTYGTIGVKVWIYHGNVYKK